MARYATENAPQGYEVIEHGGRYFPVEVESINFPAIHFYSFKGTRGSIHYAKRVTAIRFLQDWQAGKHTHAKVDYPDKNLLSTLQAHEELHREMGENLPCPCSLGS